MFKRILIHELKNIVRDKMYAFFVGYSMMMIIASYFLVPYLKDINLLASNILALSFILINAFMFGAVTGFTLLDDQDDKVLLSLKITPVSVRNYIQIKLAICYLFGLLATALMIIATNLISIAPLFDLILIAILVPMQGPIIALLINSFANNKVEGFVIMKFSGIILMAPIASIFLTNWTELFLGILPGFWPARMISMVLIPGNYTLSFGWIYFILGVFINLLSLIIFFKIYQKRVNI
jgi:fluoroquinolone transport system permease protein